MRIFQPQSKPRAFFFLPLPPAEEVVAQDQSHFRVLSLTEFTDQRSFEPVLPTSKSQVAYHWSQIWDVIRTLLDNQLTFELDDFVLKRRQGGDFDFQGISVDDDAETNTSLPAPLRMQLFENPASNGAAWVPNELVQGVSSNKLKWRIGEIDTKNFATVNAVNTQKTWPPGRSIQVDSTFKWIKIILPDAEIWIWAYSPNIHYPVDGRFTWW